jgi:hypothetical protein
MNLNYRYFFISICILFFSCKKKEISNVDITPPVVVTPPTVTAVTGIPDAPEPVTDKDYLDKIQKETFRYFWDFGHPASGMARERTTSGEIVTTGGTGFGVMATVVAVNRNWVSRTEAVQRLNKICDFLLKSDRFHGVFPHWYTAGSGKVKAFSAKDDGGDLVETSFMIAGLLTAKEYFKNSDEAELRNKIQNIVETVEWSWHVKDGRLYWHWSPNYAFEMNFVLKGYNETLITHVLAMASTKFPITKQIYDNSWNVSKMPRDFLGYNLDLGEPNGGPLFFSHYSFLGLDPHFLKDNSTYFWNQSVNHTMINRNYCVYKAPKENGYSEELWGLSSSDEPNGYSDHSVSRDNGTIAPTAALSSMPYTPFYSMQALKGFYKQKNKLYGGTGFHDAFNIKANWFDNQSIAIDQGPIIIMIENYRSGLIWNLFMQIPEIKSALLKMAFSQPTLANGFPYIAADLETKNVDLMKHPDSNQYEIDFVADAGMVNLGLYTADGTLEKTIVSNQMASNSPQKTSFDAKAGTYKLKLTVGSKETIINVKLR